MEYERVIIGSGIYGMYAAFKSLENHPGDKILVIDTEDTYFNRGSYVNQARLHNGYHYPRSYSTASKSVKYFDRFYNDFHEEINNDFKKVYAIASDYSWTNGSQFQNFCRSLNILCEEIPREKFFNQNNVDKAFLTKEYSFDAQKIGDKLYNQLVKLNCKFSFNTQILRAEKVSGKYILHLSNKQKISTKFILNATYAGINIIHNIFGFDYLPIKYELCEVILCNVSENIKKIGITVMDGPFFSIMPFGLTGYHSITTVSRTPHYTSYESIPPYDCCGKKDKSSDHQKGCIFCKKFPKSAFREMTQIAKKYLNDNISIEYVKSLYTIKPILISSEIDDSRPTIIKQYSASPDFYTVFSGKINTIYDLDGIL